MISAFAEGHSANARSHGREPPSLEPNREKSGIGGGGDISGDGVQSDATNSDALSCGEGLSETKKYSRLKVFNRLYLVKYLVFGAIRCGFQQSLSGESDLFHYKGATKKFIYFPFVVQIACRNFLI